MNGAAVQTQGLPPSGPDTPAAETVAPEGPVDRPVDRPVEVRGGRLIRAVVACMAFVSGFTIMSIELLGGRVMAPYFGSSVYVWGSIITIFMLSLSLGYLWGGRLSMRRPSPLTYSLFFFAAAVLTLPIIYFSDWIMGEIFLIVEDPRYGSLISAVLLYFLPICVLGMISPYSVRLLVETEEHSGHMAGLLYFVSTLGSALGTLATSFYFVLWFNIDTIMWGLFLALVLAGCIIVATYKLAAPIKLSGGRHEQ